MVDEIITISMGRTGTTYICKLLELCPNTLSLHEIYHKDHLFLPDDVKAYVKEYLQVKTDWDVMCANRFNTEKYIQAILYAKHKIGKEVVCYKVFPWSKHLDTSQLDKFFFPRQNTGYVLVDRNPLLSYISLYKALTIRKWECHDTTDIYIHFNSADFYRYYLEHQKLVADVNWLANKHDRPLLVLHYEDLFTLETDQEKFKYIQNRYEEVFGVKLEDPESIDLPFFKQDQSRLQDTMDNYGEMVEFLKSKNLEHLLDKI